MLNQRTEAQAMESWFILEMTTTGRVSVWKNAGVSAVAEVCLGAWVTSHSRSLLFVPSVGLLLNRFSLCLFVCF